MSYIAPLLIILLFRFFEEIVQYIRVWRRDKQINGRMYDKMVKSGFVKTKSGDLCVGDIIKLIDERVPADIIILAAK